MKLKTLEDVAKKSELNESNEWNGGVDALQEDLRQEVIKHIKSKIKHIESHSHKLFDWNGIYLECIICRNHYVQIKWIMYFFNVKRDDVI